MKPVCHSIDQPASAG
jgi:hypothetical protein